MFRFVHLRLFRATTVSVCSLLFVVSLAHAEEPVQFNRDIRPILADNCFVCHGFDEQKREAGLRLDRFEAATEGDAVVPGDADSSEIIARMISDDPDTIMPPTDTEKQLTSDQIELVSRWISQGAEYQQHWAWQPLERPATPGTTVPPISKSFDDVKESITDKAARIDAFIDAGYQENDLQPVGLATPRERIRRLSFDLRGLPPAMEDVLAFEKDPQDEKLFAIRDRWMTDLAYAEHQAVRWLDLVRWADTSGFVSDEPIASGAYRAWVIRALASNQPFDQFSREQLAGDLLSNPTDDQFIASGYNRIVNTNCEAGAIETEQLYKLKGEHVRALGTVWLGMTTGCAECHDHKFDPITARDYYSLGAFFDDLVEAGVYTPGDRREPLHYVHDQATNRQRDRELKLEIRQLQRAISQGDLGGQREWEQVQLERLKDQAERGEFVWIPARLPAPRVLQGDFEIISMDDRIVRDTVAGDKQMHRHVAAEFMTGWVSHGGQKTDAKEDGYYTDVWIDPDNRPQMLGLQILHGDYGRLGWKTANYETYYWGDDTSGTIDEPQPWSDPKRVKRIGDLPTDSGWVRLKIPFDQLIASVSGQSFESVGMAWMHTGGHVRWGDSGLELRQDKVEALELAEIGIRKWWKTPMNRQFFDQRGGIVAKALKRKPSDRSELDREVIQDAYRELSQPEKLEELRKLESELFRLRRDAMPVLVSRQADSRKTTRLLNRGDYQDVNGPVVSPALPEFLSQDTDDGAIHQSKDPLSRLDLANWLFTDGSDLTARVFVNRLWHQFYGRGISETLEDSGTQGDWPSHLALLNWLACEFRDSGWDRNHMIRLLTSTRTYQLSSTPTHALRSRDPANRWHTHQSRHRLMAESIRDAALHASGLLHQTKTIPIQSFFPYQPNAYWTRSDKVMFGSRHLDWSTSPFTSQYHRSLYTYWKRQNIHPTMLAFDAPTRQECTAKRNITNTPGQALALLNDPIFVEAARALAQRALKLDESDDEKLNAVYEWSLQRTPTSKESEVLLSLLVDQRTYYGEHADEAAQLVAIGQASSPPSGAVAETAAWTVVTRTVLNLHEFVTRP